MDQLWALDDNGNLKLPRLAGFSLAVAADILLALQLKVANSHEELRRGGQALQAGMTAQNARELAGALLQAAEALERASIQPKVN
jgi:HAMP domain-containing protein